MTRSGPSPIEDAAAAAMRGEPIVLPTDTVYGIGTRPDDPSATARLFDAKGRPRSLELPILVPDVASAREIAVFDDRAASLAGRFWPGALTLILPRTARSALWDLGGDRTTIGVRQPHDVLALAVLAIAGPLAVTSANASGEATPTDCDALVRIFGDRVAVYLCRDEPLIGVASTVLDLAHGEARVVRGGSILPDEIEAALEG